MKPNKGKNILVALDLTHQSGRDHLAGFYGYAEKKPAWRVKFVPSTEESYLPLIRAALAEGLDGAILKCEAAERLVGEFNDSRMPIVIIDQPPESLFRHNSTMTICNDNMAIGREAAYYFSRLGQFADYAFVPEIDNLKWSTIRGQAFKTALSESRKRCKMYTNGPSGPDDHAKLADFLRGLDKPAAIFAAFDYRAVDVMEACRDIDLKIPDDIALLGVDNDTLICDHTRPKLTSIRPDHEKQGYCAAQELDRAMRQTAPDQNFSKVIVIRQAEVVERDSTVRMPPAVHLVREARRFIDANATKGITAGDVVKKLGVSSRLANLRFSHATGHSIREEIILRRLDEVKRLLTATPYPMTRIARECGFKSALALSKLFKKRFGMAMGTWRTKHPDHLPARDPR